MKIHQSTMCIVIIAGLICTYIAIGLLGTFGIFLMLWGNNLDLTRKKLLEDSE